ncbi:hypothetical protein [Hymenobacter pini]|uniref:hypothetical protein n=1 Tax=Hymenobacter pini TaxID=2880879 RepID=UPI001CF39921|nr:hypothetical protein [Hymenobacter pini]MCA8830274.1 hypothetical protein [Hymenobacter pini]
MRYILLLGVLSLAACKTIETTINQTGTGHMATTTAAQEPGPVATGAGATAVEAKKPEAPVQAGAGNQQQATDNTKAGQRNGSAASGAGSSASNESEKGGTPWWAYALLICGGVVGGWLLRGKASAWSWWPSWARPG